MQPQNLGRYEIVEELGRGAMGRVFLAHDPQIERKVAIKTVGGFESLPPDERAEACERFLNEARAAGKLMHPGIVTLFDVGVEGEVLYLAMEYVEGTTLDAFCKPDSLLPVKTVANLVAGIAEALNYAHSSGIVHRDIKPANLMRVAEDRVKIMDLGLAKPTQAQLSHGGSLVGTPGYMAPEQIRGARVDARSDLFSLAIVLFELLTGERPFPGDSVSSILYRIVNEPARQAGKVSDRVPAQLDAFLEGALSKDPDQRPQDGKQFADALRQAAAAAPEVVPPDPVPVDETAQTSASLRKKPERPPRSSPMPFVLALIVVLAGLGFGAFYYRDQLGLEQVLSPREVFWEATVRTEPPALAILVDGEPMNPDVGSIVRFSPEGPFPVLSATEGCRTAEHTLSAADAGAEVVLLVDPVELHWPLDAGIAEASVSLNGEVLGASPMDLRLDLCRDNKIEIAAPGYRPAELELKAGITPLAGRTALAGLTLEKIPRGRLVLPDFSVDVIYYLDGKRLQPRERSLELEEGEYTVRIRNDGYWIDATRKVKVAGGETVTSSLEPPRLTTLVVQAFPANCKVELRRPGGPWKYLDETPLSKNLAAGTYEVRVTLNPTGEARVQEVDLVPGENPPVRIAFGDRG